jgi:hypothetical protein
MDRETLRYWLNFREDGAWQWWWYQIRQGCSLGRGHAWVITAEAEDWGDGTYPTGWYFDECSRCGAGRHPYQ